MIRVCFYSRFGEDDPTPRSAPESARAVPLAPYALEENGAGAVAFMEVHADDVKPLGDFAAGEEVLIESNDPMDAHDLETETATRNTHLWWRAVVLGPEET